MLLLFTLSVLRKTFVMLGCLFFMLARDLLCLNHLFLCLEHTTCEETSSSEGCKETLQGLHRPHFLQESASAVSLPLKGFCAYGDGFGQTCVLWPSRFGEQLLEHFTDQSITGLLIKA